MIRDCLAVVVPNVSSDFVFSNFVGLQACKSTEYLGPACTRK